MIKRYELVATHGFELTGGEDIFHFRLEIYRMAEGFKGAIFRLDRYRLKPTFSEGYDNGTLLIDDALFYIKDEFIDDVDLVGDTQEEVVSIFIEKLNSIFQLS